MLAFVRGAPGDMTQISTPVPIPWSMGGLATQVGTPPWHGWITLMRWSRLQPPGQPSGDDRVSRMSMVEAVGGRVVAGDDEILARQCRVVVNAGQVADDADEGDGADHS